VLGINHLASIYDLIEKYSYLKDQFILLAFGFLIFLASSLVAKRLGFFILPPDDRSTPLNIWNVFSVFGLYLGTIAVVLPGVIVTASYAIYGRPVTDLDFELGASGVNWLNLATIFFSVVVVIGYTFFLRQPKFDSIWNKDRKPAKGLVRDYFIGASLWFICYPLIIFVSQLVDILMSLYLNKEATEDQVIVKYLKDLSEDNFLLILSSLIIIFLVPIAEEIMFRGIFQTWIKKYVGRTLAILATALFFSSMHFSFSQGLANYQLLLSLFLLACFLGIVYERQRSLWASIGLHTVFNAISVGLILIK
jgi:uncharacterized protein